MTHKFKRYSLCLDDKTYNTIKEISDSTGDSIAEVSRNLIQKGLAKDYVDDSKDIIASIVREQLEIVLKPKIERLAKIGSKAGHMSATAVYLNVQALQDLVPKELRKNPVEMYEKARVKAISYMKNKIDD